MTVMSRGGGGIAGTAIGPGAVVQANGIGTPLIGKALAQVTAARERCAGAGLGAGDGHCLRVSSKRLRAARRLLEDAGVDCPGRFRRRALATAARRLAASRDAQVQTGLGRRLLGRSPQGHEGPDPAATVCWRAGLEAEETAWSELERAGAPGSMSLLPGLRRGFRRLVAQGATAFVEGIARLGLQA